MSEITIQVPAEHLEAVRQSLAGRRGDVGRTEEVDGLLWNAVYDSLCAAAEQLADDCNEYWRGGIDPGSARVGVTAVAVLLELLVTLGPPPGR